MYQSADKIEVSFQGKRKSILLVKNLNGFIKSVKSAFQTIPDSFIMSYEDEDGIINVIRNEEDFRRAYEQVIVVIDITSNEEEKSANAKIELQDYLTPGGRGNPLTIEEERMGTSLEIITDVYSIIINEENDGNLPKCRIGTVCEMCRGTGEMNSAAQEFIKELENKVREDTLKTLENKIKKKDDELNVKITEFEKAQAEIKELKERLKKVELELKQQLEKRRQEVSNEKQSIVSSIYKGKQLNCSICRCKLENGDTVFLCRKCTELSICENCEESFKHEHALLKLRTEGTTNYYKANIDPKHIIKETSNIGRTLELLLTVWNIGKKVWPKDTIIEQIDEISEGKTVIIGSIKPGQKKDILLNWKVPRNLKTIYRFSLFGDGNYFGEELILEIRGLRNRRNKVGSMNARLDKGENDIGWKRINNVCRSPAEESPRNVHYYKDRGDCRTLGKTKCVGRENVKFICYINGGD